MSNFFRITRETFIDIVFSQSTQLDKINNWKIISNSNIREVGLSAFIPWMNSSPSSSALSFLLYLPFHNWILCVLLPPQLMEFLWSPPLMAWALPPYGCLLHASHSDACHLSRLDACHLLVNLLCYLHLQLQYSSFLSLCINLLPDKLVCSSKINVQKLWWPLCLTQITWGYSF